MTVTFRDLEITDDHIAHANLLKQLTIVNLDEMTKENFQSRLTLIKQNPLHRILVAVDGEHLVGTITVFIEPKFTHNLSAVAHIEDLVVDKTYRAGGIGRKLVSLAIDFAKEKHCYKIILDTESHNIEFYQKLGFSIKQQQMGFYLNH